MPSLLTRQTQAAVLYTQVDTPIGALLATADEPWGALTGLWFDRAPAEDWRHDDNIFSALRVEERLERWKGHAQITVARPPV